MESLRFSSPQTTLYRSLISKNYLTFLIKRDCKIDRSHFSTPIWLYSFRFQYYWCVCSVWRNDWKVCFVLTDSLHRCSAQLLGASCLPRRRHRIYVHYYLYYVAVNTESTMQRTLSLFLSFPGWIVTWGMVSAKKVYLMRPLSYVCILTVYNIRSKLFWLKCQGRRLQDEETQKTKHDAWNWSIDVDHRDPSNRRSDASPGQISAV